MNTKYTITYHLSKEKTLNKYKNIKELKDNEVKLLTMDDITEIIKNVIITTLKECIKFAEITDIYIYISTFVPNINDDKLNININGYENDCLCFNEIKFIKLNEYINDDDKYKELLMIYNNLTYIKDIVRLKTTAKKDYNFKKINDISISTPNDNKEIMYYINLVY